jgi:hydroxypyruvate reductase
MEKELREILEAGLAAADPKDAVMRSVRLEGDTVFAADARFEPERIFVVAAGKAAGAMARAGVVAFLGDHDPGLDASIE